MAALDTPFVEADGDDQVGLQLVTVEATGCDCPLVLPDLPATAYVVEQPAFRVSPGNSDDLAAAIHQIIELLSR